ncbi:unnamed protein product [Caenorhabditis angaria]|uniref:Tyrosine-protein phosphatase domain-containing protein n=1 Tax=Caenorhabditis angaria TaxID=860376 RepID=A0A9P1INF0_9PELO|nr:unnamed protein product [Caenorhabditis angaria]
MLDIPIIIGLLLASFIHGCAKKKNKKRVETARSIAQSPSSSPNITPPPVPSKREKSKKESKIVEEDTPPPPIDLTPDKYFSTEVPYEPLSEWLQIVVTRYIEWELLIFNNEPDCENVRKRKWFLQFDKNPTLNRYEAPKCYDYSRVVLKNRKNDYINATWMFYENVKNILTQGPLSNTIPDFWAMICQENVEYIVMLCSFIEKSVEQSAQYYPLEEGGVEKYEEFEVRCVKKEKDPVEGVTWTILEITDSDGKTKRTVNHIHVSWWPDKTAPEDAKLTIELYRWLSKKSSKFPKVYHCDSGLGRSACFLAVDMFLRIYQLSYDDIHHSKTNERINFYVRNMRNGAIDSPLLQLFLLVCILEFCHQEKKGITQEKQDNGSIISYKWLVFYDAFVKDYQRYRGKLIEDPNAKIELPKRTPG